MMVCLNMNNFFVNDIDKILVDIYVIGYESQGESIYIRIKTLDNQYVKDILIDCYATQYNKTLELLENLKGNENQIDYICVSHYHDDHIKEIDKIINKYSKKNTIILIPDVDREDSLTEMAKNVRNCIADRRINGRKIWGHIKKISEPQQNIFFEELEYNDKKISIEISAISPYSDITIVNSKRSIEDINQNDYAIALVIKIGQLKILCTSDIMNNTIRLLNNQGNVHYIKIPHHASIDSNKIFEKVKMSSNTICVSTNYKTSDLPNEEILKLYKEKTNDVYVTHKENSDNNYDYGIVHTRYVLELNKKEIKYSTECLKNSEKYEREEIWNV